MERKSDGTRFTLVDVWVDNSLDTNIRDQQLDSIWARINGTWKDASRGLMPIIITGSFGASADNSNIYQSLTENNLFFDTSKVAKSNLGKDNSARTGDYVFVSHHNTVDIYKVLGKQNTSYPLLIQITLPKVCSHVVTETAANPATCTEAGNKAYYTCTKCGNVYADVYGTVDTTVAESKIPALGHDWDNDCDTDCNRDNCDETREITHDYEWVIDLQPTLDTTGLKHEVCTICGDIRNEGTIIDKLTCEHALTKTEAVAATCLKTGNKAYYTCSKCGKVYSNAEGTLETTVAECITAIAPHSWKDATCKAPKTCSVCGAIEGDVSTEHDINNSGRCNVCGKDFSRRIALYGGKLPYGGTYTGDNTAIADAVTGVVGRTITLPTPSISNHSFGGWYLDYACTNPFEETTYSENLTLYAKWIPNTESIKVMSFNVKTEIYKGSRKDRVLEVIKNQDPDVICFQEVDETLWGAIGWMPYFNDQLPDLGYTAVYANKWGRDGENSGEHTAIFYKTDKFEATASGTKWLSNTPDVVSKYSYVDATGKTQTANYNRIMTYVVLKHKDAGSCKGGSFVVVNTHLDNNGSKNTHTDANGKDVTHEVAEKIREAEVDIMMDIIKDITKSRGDLPVIVTGDFNIIPTINRTAYKAMTVTYGYSDSAYAAPTNKSDKGENTYTGMGEGTPSILDYIFVSRHMKDKVTCYDVCDPKVNGEYASDHNAIVSTINVPYVKDRLE